MHKQKKVRTTKKAERAALQKARRRVRRKLSAKRRAKRAGAKRVTATHPHRKSTSIAKRR